MSTTLTPAIAIHVTAALGALVLGPIALWARRGAKQRPRLHRAFGYAWVTLMVVTAISAMFIRGGQLPNIHGFSPIHLLVPVTLFSLFGGFWFLARGNVRGHRIVMTNLYFGACVVAGAFTLLPDRLLGQLVWGEWLGLLSQQDMGSHAAHARRYAMLGQILANTPLWVWGLLATLLALGLSQLRSRDAGMARVVMLPLGMAAFSLWGTASTFGAAPILLAAWFSAAALLVFAVTQLPLPAATAYDTERRRFRLPGSWVPMLLILGIFLTKYAVGVALVMRPELKADADLTLAIAAVYGVFSGIFAGRTVRLLRLARRPALPTSALTA